MDNYTVYMHVNKINNKKYIGITKQNPKKRWANGKGYLHNLYFTNAIKKYGWDEGFLHDILYSNLSEDEAKNIEIKLISLHKSNDRLYGYNISAGGDGSMGCFHTEESRKKMSINRIGKYRGEYSTWYGKQRSEQTKLKISLANSGENSAWYGKHHTEEQKRKISEGNKGSNGSAYGKFGKDHPTSKMVICIETNTVYDSLTIAHNETGINIGNISSCCNGKIRSAGKTFEGVKLTWMYYDEYLLKHAI